MAEVIVVREWDAEAFHRRVLELEGRGYQACRDSYRITADTDPSTGNVVHLHSMEMVKPEP